MAWATLAVLLSPVPVVRTVLMGAYAALWARQAARPWPPPARLVPYLALAILLLPVLAPAAGSDLGGFRPFPFAEGAYADGALGVATAPVWIHLAVLARDVTWPGACR